LKSRIVLPEEFSKVDTVEVILEYVFSITSSSLNIHHHHPLSQNSSWHVCFCNLWFTSRNYCQWGQILLYNSSRDRKCRDGTGEQRFSEKANVPKFPPFFSPHPVLSHLFYMPWDGFFPFSDIFDVILKLQRWMKHVFLLKLLSVCFKIEWQKNGWMVSDGTTGREYLIGGRDGTGNRELNLHLRTPLRVENWIFFWRIYHAILRHNYFIVRILFYIWPHCVVLRSKMSRTPHNSRDFQRLLA
jgi:hypothetical protein